VLFVLSVSRGIACIGEICRADQIWRGLAEEWQYSSMGAFGTDTTVKKDLENPRATLDIGFRRSREMRREIKKTLLHS
jgi:hypothetical protein